MKKKFISILLTSLLLTIFTCVYENENDYSSTQPMPQTNNSEEITLSNYTVGEVHFTDKDEVMALAQNYDIENPQDIEEIIYVPIEETTELDDEVKHREVGGYEFYAKRITSYEKGGGLIRSSWYRSPGGAMTINEEYSSTVSFNNESSMSVGKSPLNAALKSSLRFSVTKARTVSDTQKVTVKSGHKRNCKAYVNNKVYKFELWEDDPKYDDYVGKGYVKKPVGVIFTLSKNKAL